MPWGALLACLKYLYHFITVCRARVGDPDSLLCSAWLSDQGGVRNAPCCMETSTISSLTPSPTSAQWDQNERFLVVLNFGDVGQLARLWPPTCPPAPACQPRSICCSAPSREKGTSLELEHLNLQPQEGLLLRFPYVA